MKREEVLQQAMQQTNGSRTEDYGTVENNFSVIAKFWNAYLNTNIITTKDVAAMMALLKIARISSGHAKSDNWVDLAGYAACGGELEESNKVIKVADGRGGWFEKSV